MAILYKTTKWDVNTEGPSLTEQEHKDSCDINKMIKNALRGQDVRGGGSGQYGYDDVNMDALTFRIQKQQLEEQLQNGPKEFTQEVLDLIPESIKNKFGYKRVKNDEIKNDDKNPTNVQTTPPPTTPPTT